MVPVLLLIANAWQSGATDSLGVLRSARRAQATFEATRRANLPERPGGWSGGSSRIIGRIRIWYESGVDDETPPAEPSRIRQARARLLMALAGAGAAIPGDEWIVCQRVRYLSEDGQRSAAARVVEQCRAVEWWSQVPGGIVRHVPQGYVGAASLFADALAGMPEDERCRWTDISPLLEGELAARYRRLDCAGRAALEARSEEHTSELQSRGHLVCRLLLEKKKQITQ